MFRRLLACLLLMGYLAGMLAGVPHAHAAISVADHARPHVHGDWLFGKRSVDQHHRHHHPGHDHHHDSSPVDHAPAPADQTAAVTDTTVTDTTAHDHDADYIPIPPSQVATGAKSGMGSKSGTSDFFQVDRAAAPVALACDSLAESRPFARAANAPPDDLYGGCRLFLKLRNLRI